MEWWVNSASAPSPGFPISQVRTEKAPSETVTWPDKLFSHLRALAEGKRGVTDIPSDPHGCLHASQAVLITVYINKFKLY